MSETMRAWAQMIAEAKIKESELYGRCVAERVIDFNSIVEAARLAALKELRQGELDA